MNSRLPMSFGWVPKREALLQTALYERNEQGRNGFIRLAEETAQPMSAVIPGRNGEADTEIVLPIAQQSDEELALLDTSIFATQVSAWLPGSVKVDPWPFRGVVHNESFVPRDAESHYFFQCGWKRVENEKEREEWTDGQLGQVRWKIPVVNDFTEQDAEARESTHPFYMQEGGWEQERLAHFDLEILMWRLFAGENARGIQRPEHTRGHFKR